MRAIEEAIAFVAKHSLHGADIGAVRRKERWNLPPVAVREAMINAVAHADYAQRGAPIRISIFDDRFEIDNPGLLPFGLTIEDLEHGFTTRVTRPSLDDTDQAIVDALSDGAGRLISEIAVVIGLTPRATRTRLARLVGNGLLREVGTGPQDPKRRYFSASLHY